MAKGIDYLKQVKEALCPGHGKLKSDKGGHYTNILDAELDPIHCKFHNDDCVHIDTENCTYIVLTASNLRKLLKFITDTKNECNQMTDEDFLEREAGVGYTFDSWSKEQGEKDKEVHK